MKRIIPLISVLLLAVLLCSCGNISNVKISSVKSDIYSEEDIIAAENAIINEFKLNWSGCTLKEIHYAGDNYADDMKHWENFYNKDEAIVLLSTFDVDSSGGDGSLNPNSTYDNWNWILVRNKGGQWEHKDHGY